MSPQKHGFLPGKSSYIYLFEFVTLISRIFFLNSFHHFTVLTKLRILGFNDCIMSCLNSYLYNRMQQILFEGFTSSHSVSSSGVQQGSHFGLLLFLIFINYSPNYLALFILLLNIPAMLLRYKILMLFRRASNSGFK